MKPKLDPSTRDCLFIAAVFALSVAPYLTRIGFYSDDWADLAIMSLAPDQSLIGLLHELFDEWVRMRPLQVLHMAVLYEAFGLDPLGYHVVNALVFLVGLLPFYLALRELGVERLVGLSIVLVYSLLPHYCTDRFWAVACQNINLSAALYFLSLYAELRAARADSPAPWKLLAVSGLVLSAMAYEIFLPLFVLNVPLALYRARRVAPRPHLGGAHALRFALPNLLALLLVVPFKALLTVRGSAEPFVAQIGWFFGLLDDATRTSFGTFGVRLPSAAIELAERQFDPMVAALAVLMAALIFTYLLAASRSSAFWERRLSLAGLISAGLVVFALGYAIFLSNREVGITATGINNRTAIASACGTAIVMVGASALLGSVASGVTARLILCGSIALICAMSFVITSTLSSFWVRAYDEQQRILANLRRAVPVVADGSAVLLDGICPYAGPAIVFESQWDLRGALRILYRQRALRADVVTPNLEVRHDGLYTSLYGYQQRYPLADLIVYDERRKLAQRVSGFDAANEYFSAHASDRFLRCPDAEAGIGVPVLSVERIAAERADAATVEGWLDSVRALDPLDGGIAVAQGWALVDRSRPPASVVISVAGRWMGITSRFVSRPDVSAFVGREISPCGWRIEFSTDGLAPGRYPVEALALPEGSSAVRPLEGRRSLQVPPAGKGT